MANKYISSVRRSLLDQWSRKVRYVLRAYVVCVRRFLPVDPGTRSAHQQAVPTDGRFLKLSGSLGLRLTSVMGRDGDVRQRAGAFVSRTAIRILRGESE